MTTYVLLARLEKEIEEILNKYEELYHATQGHRGFPATLRDMEYDDIHNYSAYAKRAYAAALRAVQQMISVGET